jgi:hypothetical protein
MIGFVQLPFSSFSNGFLSDTLRKTAALLCHKFIKATQNGTKREVSKARLLD